MQDARRFCTTRQNEVPGYRRFRKTSEYLMERAAGSDVPDGLLRSLFPLEKGDPRLLLSEILSLRRPIPILLLDQIGAAQDAVIGKAEEDYQEFLEVIRDQILYPRYATIRFMAAVYKTMDLPGGWPEEDAISYLLQYTKQRRVCASIIYPELKGVFIEPRGAVKTTLYPPSISFTGQSLVPGKTGYGEGQSYIR